MISALGLDIGRRRIGVSGCDGLGLIAVGLATIKRRSFDHDIAQIKQFIVSRNAQILVVGLPYTMSGEISAQAKQIQKFAHRLEKVLHLPVDYVDERFTSVEAEELMYAESQSPSQNKALIDRKAAAIILQRWLDERHSHSTS